MNIQLNSYFQQSLSKHSQIDRRLQPLLDIIKQNKINSVHQLANDLVSEDLPIDHHVLSAIHKRSIKRSTFRKIYSEQDKKSPQKRKNSIMNTPGMARKYQSKSASENRNSHISQNDQPLVYRSPNSKAKKHLIESMKFQSLQTLMNEKTSKSNPYKQFIENLEKKRNGNSEQKRKHVSLYRLEKVRLIDNEQAIEIFEKCSMNNQDNLFKVKIRRKFWKREKPSLRDKPNLSNVLCVKGMKNMAMTIQ